MFFGENDDSSVNGKWNINEFLVGNKSRGRSNSRNYSSGTNKENYELESTIRTIDSKFSKTESNLESIFKDLKSKRKEMRARFKSLESDPESEAAFHKIDVDLIMAQVRVTESKAKAVSDKLKHIRDEKKLFKDLTKGTEVVSSNIETTVQGNNPINNVKPESTNNVIRTNTISASMISEPKHVFNTNTIKQSSEEQQEPVVKIPCEVREKKTIPVTKNWDGEVITSTGDNINDRQEEIKFRLANADNMLKNSKSIQGIDYDRSVNAIINKHKKNLEQVLFVNRMNGRFYVRDYEILEDGSKVLSDSETPDSVTHIGILTFNPRLNLAKSAYSDDAISYVVVDNDSEMPEYYMDQWSEPDKERFLIPSETLELLSE